MAANLKLSYLRKAIQNMPDAGEFALVIGVSFGYSTWLAITDLFLESHGIVWSDLTIIQVLLRKVAQMLVVAFVLTIRGWGLHQIGFRLSWSAVLAGVPVLLSYWVLYVAASFLALRFYPLALDPHAAIIPQASVGLVLAETLVNSVFEESLVCGYVVSVLACRGVVLSITVSALIRMAYHLYYGPMVLIVILPMGLLFSLVYWKWRNLWPLITAHALQTIWVSLVAPYLNA
jgi:membrane protease YdiL (CAAX protease family)